MTREDVLTEELVAESLSDALILEEEARLDRRLAFYIMVRDYEEHIYPE